MNILSKLAMRNIFIVGIVRFRDEGRRHRGFNTDRSCCTDVGLDGGAAEQKRGYVFISETDLKAIDELRKKYSDGRFGYSVQKKIWKKSSRDFTSFFLKVGWMKKLDTEVEQYNYRSFPIAE
ncbi:Tetrapyrrole-binding protein, chloroplastic [Sarracenia purpurea var. burkii]